MVSTFTDPIGYEGAGIRAPIEQVGADDIKAPKHIIKSVAAARSLYSIVREQNLKRFALWAAIDGLIAGNPPYNQADLDKHGLGYLANFNDLSARARFEKKCLAYFNLIHQAEILVKFVLHGVDDPDAQKWAQILSINFDKSIRKWKSFTTMLGTHMAQLCKLGLSVLLWPDERDWRPRTVQLNRFLVPDQTVADLDQLTFCFFENDFTAQYLYEAWEEVKKKKQSTDDPYKHFWHLQALENLLLQRANMMNKATGTAYTDFVQLQSAIDSGDLSFHEAYGDGIRLVTLLYKEYNGKITHYMFDTTASVSDFVFRADDQYTDFGEACAIFTSSPGEFTLHANKGIGHKIFAPCQAKNQLACSLIDMARFSSTPMLRSNAGPVRDPQQIRMYPGVPTDIGAADFVQNTLGSNLQQVMGVLQFFDSNLTNNLGIGRDDPAVPDQSQGSISPTEARQRSYREFNILKDEVAHFYTQMDAVYRNMVAIMLRCKEGYPGYEFAKEWKERCVLQGVPESIFDVKGAESGLPEQISVKATRVAGDGSTVGMMLGLQEIGATIGGDLSPRAAKAFKRDMILAALGPDAIDRYTAGDSEPDEISGGASLAGVENAVMRGGEMPVFSPSNEHRAHFAVHLALNVSTMQSVQQQQTTPIDAQKIFDVSIPHTDEHWNFILRSPFSQNFVGQYKEAWGQIKDYAVLNKKNAIKMYQAQIREQQEAQEQQQKVLSDVELKNLQTQADIERRNVESQDKMERQNRESEHRSQLKEKEVQDKVGVDRVKAQLDAGVKQSKVENEASIERSRVELQKLTEVDLPK